MSEVDPNGKSANEPGAKLDSGKVRPALVIQGFRKALLAISEVGTFGAAKYTDNGWKSVPDGRKRYEDALYRHLLAEGVDEQSGLPHLAHAAWNLLAMLELEQQHLDDLCESQKPQPTLATEYAQLVDVNLSKKMWEFSHRNPKNEKLFQIVKEKWVSRINSDGVDFKIIDKDIFFGSELIIDGIHVPSLPDDLIHNAITQLYPSSRVKQLLAAAGVHIVDKSEENK